MSHRQVRKIVSGGQTGVDRGALDAAIELGLPHGGWCPRRRRAEDGPIPARYLLTETDSPEYRVRTERNVLDSDGTLILARGVPTGGTELTRQLAETHAKPCLIVDLNQPPALAAVRRWLKRNRVAVLNVAGPRESQSPGIGAQATEFVKTLFAR
ncbi:MAG: putative molybdenum carrier protein [Pirellulales bacterium]